MGIIKHYASLLPLFVTALHQGAAIRQEHTSGVAIMFLRVTMWQILYACGYLGDAIAQYGLLGRYLEYTDASSVYATLLQGGANELCLYSGYGICKSLIFNAEVGELVVFSYLWLAA